MRTQDGVCFVDQERRITYWNSGAETLTGYLRHEVVGRRCPESLLRHCTAEGAELCESGCPLEAFLADGQPREAFVFLRHKRGYRVPVRVRVTAVRDAQGVIAGAAEVFEEHERTCGAAWIRNSTATISAPARCWSYTTWRTTRRDAQPRRRRTTW